MTEDVGSKNAALLRSRFPGLWEKLIECSEAEQPYSLSVAGGAKGEPSLSADGRWVHSKFDPRREAERLASLAEGDGPLVVLGFGLGYAAEAAALAAPERLVIVAEKNPRVLALALGTRDLTAFLGRDRLVFVVGGDPSGVLAALDSQKGKPAILSNRTLRELDPAWYDEAENAVRAWKSKDEINAATLKKFGSRWLRNLARNLELIRDVPGVAGLAGCAAGLPALLVAAGPTLDEILPLLPDIARRCVVVAVDTSLRAVLAAGVEPDFVVVVDPQYWNARHLDRCATARAALIAESAVYPSVLESTFSRVFLCSSLFPLGRYVEDAVDPKGALGAGGSVATTAWDFVRLLGASPIWAAGLDLSFPDLKTHFKGALFEERAHAEAQKTAPGELRSFKALRDGLPFTAPDAAGSSVLTDKRLSLYAAWFESRFRRFPEAAPLCLSGRGLRIGGMEPRPPAALTALPERREEIDRRLCGTFASVENRFNEESARRRRTEAFAERVSGLERALRSLIEVARDAERTALAALESRIDGRTLTALDRADAFIRSSEVKEVAGFLFPPTEVLEAEVSSDTADPLRANVEFAKAMYEKLAESAEYNLALLRKNGKGASEASDTHTVGGERRSAFGCCCD